MPIELTHRRKAGTERTKSAGFHAWDHEAVLEAVQARPDWDKDAPAPPVSAFFLDRIDESEFTAAQFDPGAVVL